MLSSCTLNRLKKQGLPAPPNAFGQAFYEWLAQASEALDVSFISARPTRRHELETLETRLGPIPQELAFYYSRSTPIEAEPEWWCNEALEKITEIGVGHLIKHEGFSHRDAFALWEKSPPLWPIDVRQGTWTVSFIDDQGRLAIVEAVVAGGLGFGRPRAIGLQPFLVAAVITEIIVCDEDDPRELGWREIADLSEIREITCWPLEDEPEHPLIDCFKLRLAKGISPWIAASAED